ANTASAAITTIPANASQRVDRLRLAMRNASSRLTIAVVPVILIRRWRRWLSDQSQTPQQIRHPQHEQQRHDATHGK
ncbi:MAG TPA: hypothetical protein VII92_18265, partial [Anaerolineae bacterium]